MRSRSGVAETVMAKSQIDIFEPRTSVDAKGVQSSMLRI